MPKHGQRSSTVQYCWLFILQVSNLKFELGFFGEKKTKFAHKPSFAWSCDFLVLSIEFAIKNYIESWGQTFGMPDFDIQVLLLPASGSKVPGSKKQKFITPIDPSGVVTSGCPDKNYTGFCYRGIFIID